MDSNADEEAQIATEEKKERAETLALARLMNNADFIKFIQMVLGEAHILKPSFSKAGTNWAIFWEGERNLGIRILRKICAAAPGKGAGLLNSLLYETGEDN